MNCNQDELIEKYKITFTKRPTFSWTENTKNIYEWRKHIVTTVVHRSNVMEYQAVNCWKLLRAKDATTRWETMNVNARKTLWIGQSAAKTLYCVRFNDYPVGGSRGKHNASKRRPPSIG